MEKMLPHSPEAEQAVLGSLLIDGEAIYEIEEFLLPEHFYREAHRLIYEAILRLVRSHQVADSLTLTDELERVNKLEAIGGVSYLYTLTNHVPTSSHVDDYAHIVERKAVLRQLINAGSTIVASAYAEEEQAIELAESAVYQIRQGQTGSSVSSHRDSLSRYMSSLMELHDSTENGALTGIPTGFSRLDTMLGGFRPSKMYVLAARPGEGKTAMALGFADMAVKSHCNVLFFSLEMDEGELMQRWLSMNAGVDSMKLRDGKLSGETDEHGRTEWDRVCSAEQRLRSLGSTIFIDDTPGNTIAAMRSKARRMQMEHGIDMIIVDYLQLAQVGGDRKLENRRLEVEEVSRELKNLARQLKVPVLALAQLNREVESRASRVPQLSDLREAGGIEQDCDVAMFIYKPRPEQGQERVTSYDIELNIEKHRNGPMGSIPMHYVGALTKFYPVNKEIQR